MKIATFLATLTMAVLVTVSPSAAQRIQMPSRIPLNAATEPSTQPTWAPNSGLVAQNYGTTIGSPPTGSYSGVPSGNYVPNTGSVQAPTTFATPNTFSGANSTYAPQPPASTVPSYSYPPGVAPNYAPSTAPTAQLPGTIAPAPAVGWDPYATPGCQTPSVMPTNPYLPGSSPWCYPQQPTNYVEAMTKVMQEARLDYLWMPGNGTDELGLHDADISASFNVPFFSSPSPLVLTPGFETTWWNGPSPPHPPNPEFPPRLYAGYLDTAWNPQPTAEFSGELSFRIGVYSDFDRVVNESIRYMGKGYGVLKLSPNIKIKAGVQYLDRQKIKLLPAGGLLWQPNPQMKFDILFPDPKLAWQLHSLGNSECWFYARGEYGGDSWTISDGMGGVTQTDYNDYRVAIGLDLNDPSRWKSYWEVGYSFEREIYQHGATQMSPTSTVFVAAGLAY